MKLRNYRIFYITGLIASLILTISMTAYSLYLATIGIGEGSDNIMFFVCFIILALFNSFQIYSIIHSFKYGSVFFKNIILNDQNELSKATLIATNTFLVIDIAIFIYSILLSNGMEIPLNGFPLQLDFLIICCSVLLAINLVFLDLYALVYKEEN